MSTERFYHLANPSEWATAPTIYSYTSLRQIEKCPLAWQLQNSKYTNFEGYPARPNPAGIEGEIVHEIVEKFFRAVASQGMPVITSEPFKKCVAEFDLPGSIGKAIEHRLEVIRQHPRGRGFRLFCSVQDIQNKVVRLFREQYDKLKIIDPFTAETYERLANNRISFGGKNNQDLFGLLKKRRILTEIALTLKNPPFRMVIDLVCLDSNEHVVISDFKSCAFKQEYIEQLLLCSILWEKTTHVIPHYVYVVCVDRVESVSINGDLLGKLNLELIRRIIKANEALANAPATARLNESCCFCSVRQFCSKYWQCLLEAWDDRLGTGIVDAEIMVEGIPTEYGFNGKMADGKTVNVVYGKDIWKIHGPFTPAEKLHIISGKRQPSAIELMMWTEIFHCG